MATPSSLSWQTSFGNIGKKGPCWCDTKHHSAASILLLTDNDFSFLYQNLKVMKRIVAILLALFALSVASAAAQSDYYRKKAEEYTREAEYYQKKADGYRREAEYYLKKAEGYEREASYYLKKKDTSRARTQQRYAKEAADKANTQMRYAKEADDKAAMYLRWAADALRHN